MIIEKKSHKVWRWSFTLIVVCCIFIICSSSMSRSLPKANKCMYEGSYKFEHYKSLQDEPRCTFKDGSKSSSDLGYTILEPVHDGFSFTGGNENRWQVRTTCLDENTANVKISMLNNGCKHKYITTANTTIDVGEDGEIFISAYQLQWSCGGKSLSCNMTESWALLPEIW